MANPDYAIVVYKQKKLSQAFRHLFFPWRENPVDREKGAEFKSRLDNAKNSVNSCYGKGTISIERSWLSNHKVHIRGNDGEGFYSPADMYFGLAGTPDKVILCCNLDAMGRILKNYGKKLSDKPDLEYGGRMVIDMV